MENFGASAALSLQISTGLASGCESTDGLADLGLFGCSLSAGVCQDWFDLRWNWSKLRGQTPRWLLTRCSLGLFRVDSPSRGDPGGFLNSPKLFLDELTALAAVLWQIQQPYCE